MLIIAKSTREPAEETISVVFLIWQLGSAFVFTLLCLLLLRFSELPWWANLRVAVLTVLLSVHVGLCLTRSIPALRGATDGISFVHLLLNLYTVGGMVLR